MDMKESLETMQKFVIAKIFLAFLLEKDAATNYHDALQNEGKIDEGSSVFIVLNELIKIEYPQILIIDSFDWNDSEKGEQYWMTVHNSWQKVVEENKHIIENLQLASGSILKEEEEKETGGCDSIW